ncbi:MAG: hypothetical protein SGILL_008684 [Bacillariaceae sp.]
MNKYLRDFRDSSNGIVTQEWERVDDIDPQNGISKRLKVPEPVNGVEYTRREAMRILMDISKEKKGKARDRNMVVTSWMAQGKIPLKSLSAVDRSIQQAEKDGIESIQEHWGRWGDTQHQKRKKKAETLAARNEKRKRATNSTSANENDESSNAKQSKKKKITKAAPAAVVLPPHPPPIYGNEYTKLEAVSILQKIPNAHDRNLLVTDWIARKLVPISHPNSLLRILREAKKNTLRNLDWRDGASAKTSMPWTPAPRNGSSTYSKQEMIDILSKMNATDRNKMVRKWVHDKMIPYTSALSANNAVMKAIREQQQKQQVSAAALGNGENRINTTTTCATSAIAATGSSSRKKRKLPETNLEMAPGDIVVGDYATRTTRV